MKLAPVVLFVYNRLDHTKLTIESLLKNELASETELFIFSDGAKNQSVVSDVDNVRNYIKTIKGFSRIHLQLNQENFGLARNITEGVTKVINDYGKVIVLEDDIVTSPYFLKFMNESLEKYKDTPLVWDISSYTPPTVEMNSHFFLRTTSCWGWGTWADRWKHFRRDPEYFLEKFDKETIRTFNLQNSYDYHSHIVKNAQKEMNTWAIFWYATVFFNKGLSLHPKKSFVNNIGHDESGTHCVSSNIYDVEVAKSYEAIFPTDLKLNESAEMLFIQYNKNQKPSFFERIKNKILK